MLVCPQCQFENPEEHNFCQACGTSLVEKPCPHCDALVDWSAYECPKCGTVTGSLRSLAVIPPGNPIQLESRYQILDSTQSLIQVLDREPLKPAEVDTPPDSALPYLELEPYLRQILPLLYNTWHKDDRDFLVLESRSHFMPLADFLKNNKQIPILQILHWFYEMVDLWEALEPYNLCQSLLNLTNLRLDEDHLLCLEQLLSNGLDAPSLQNLGTIWQTLLAQLTQTQSASLHLLIADLCTQSISTPDSVRSRLKAIAQETQADLSDSDIMSDPQVPDFSDAAIPDPEMPDDDIVTAFATVEAESDGDDMPTIVLPMQLFSLDDAGRTDIGRQRTHNEDCFGIDTQLDKVQSPTGRVVQARGLYVLCDGMGGHASGEVASQMALDSLRTFFRQYWQQIDQGKAPAKLPPADVIRDAIQQANKAIYTVNQEGLKSGSGRMGTTLVMLLVHDTEAAIAHVGDSRMYRYTRKIGLQQVTLDHEVGQREILRGVEPEIAYGRPDAYQLTQALGPRDEYFVNPDVQFFEINEDMV
ncbi:MAG: serine/threonine phosphatase, partial [Leptolyngbya sp. Prado105]|nr:serine/threonine phosphatase [Leptolyngbya sp. Prado105]